MRNAALALLMALAYSACREVPQAPTEPPPPPQTYLTLTLDTITGPYLDVADQWSTPALIVGSDHSVHVLALDGWNNRLRYHGCPNQCDDPTHWFAATADTFNLGLGSGGWSSGAVLTSNGFHAVRTVSIYSYYGPSLLYSHCPGACDLAANWSVSTLFVGRGWMPDLSGFGRGVPLAADSSGGLHLLFFDAGSAAAFEATNAHTLSYARCPAACGDSANWREAPLDSGAQVDLYAPKLIAVGPDGDVHVIYARGAALIHASCAAGCPSGAAWQSGAIPGVTLLRGSDTLDIDGASHLRAVSFAFERGGSLNLVYMDGSGRVALATCAGACSAPGTWSSATLPVVTSDVALAASGAGTLYLATIDGHPALSSCTTDCLNAASWKTISILSALGGGASAFGGHGAVAVDSAGGVLLASTNGGGPQVLQYSRVLP